MPLEAVVVGFRDLVGAEDDLALGVKCRVVVAGIGRGYGYLAVGDGQ